MIVGFDLERDGPAVADVHDAGVFLARLHQNKRRFAWELLQFGP